MGFCADGVVRAKGVRYSGGVSRVRRLLTTDRIFFVAVNLRRNIPFLEEGDFLPLIDALAQSRRRAGFLLCGYVLMPDHGHALMGVQYPLTISRAVQSVKWQAARKLNQRRGTKGAIWQHQF